MQFSLACRVESRKVGSDQARVARLGGRARTQVGQCSSDIRRRVRRGVVLSRGRVEEGRNVGQRLNTVGEFGVNVQAVQVGRARIGQVGRDHGRRDVAGGRCGGCGGRGERGSGGLLEGLVKGQAGGSQRDLPKRNH